MKPTAAIASGAVQRPAWPLYRAMVGVGVVCALLIALAFRYSAPLIERNRAEALQRAVLQVLPGAASFQRLEPGENVYAAFDAAGEAAGYALQAQAMGYQDTVHILYGYDPVQQAVVGMRVLQSRETPGLGDRIEHDGAFLDNFRALDVRLAEGGDALAHPIELVKPGHKTAPWQIDAISGATISSAAVASMLRDSTAQWVPLLHRRHTQAAGGGETGRAE